MSVGFNNTQLGFDNWGIHQDADRRFRQILANVLAITLFFFIVLPFWVIEPLEELKEIEEEYYLEILAPAVLEKPKTKSPDIPDTKPEPIKAIEVPKQIIPEPVKAIEPPASSPKNVQRDTGAAKKVAASSGVMAFSDQLAILRDTDTRSLASVKALRDRGSVVDDVASPSSNLMSANTRGSEVGAIDGENISDDANKLALGKHSTQKVAVSSGKPKVAVAGGGSGGGQKTRSLEEIQLAFDRSKSAFYAIFNRAARSDSTIGAGTVVVALTIQPDGSVSDCTIVSSSFFNPELKNKLIQRVKQMKFESKSVPVFVYGNYPISYVP